MAKISGKLGYGVLTETTPGVWDDTPVEKDFIGDLVKNYRSYNNGSEVNGKITVSNQISIIADPYAQNNFLNIKYATFMGFKWNVTNIDVELPRLILTLGGPYNA